MEILRKYGVETTFYFPLVDYGATDFESTPVTHASGDTQISKDGGAFANTSNAFVHEGNGIYSLTLTASEMQAALIQVTIIDQTATKTWEDQALLVATYGNASGQHAFDLDTATQSVNVSQISGDSGAADNLEADYDGTGYDKSASTIGTTTTNTDMRGTDSALLAASAPSNWSSMTIAGTGEVSADATKISGDSVAADNAELFFDNTGYNASNSTIGTTTTNTDMRGTDSAFLAASAPANIGDLAITASTGKVTVGTNDDKAGYSISGAKTTLDDLNDIAAADVGDVQLTDSVPADGTLPTLEQAIYMINQFLTERAVSGTTVTIKKVDGSTSLMTFTLDDATSPTSITRAS